MAWKIIFALNELTVLCNKTKEEILKSTSDEVKKEKASLKFLSSIKSQEQKGDKNGLTDSFRALVPKISNICEKRSVDPIFFDQTDYLIRIKYPIGALKPNLFSISRDIEESAYWEADANSYLLPINFGNDVGHFELSWSWQDKNGLRHRGFLQTDVFSKKLNILSHYKIMISDIQQIYRLIDLDLSKKTFWNWNTNANRKQALHQWLSIYSELSEDFILYIRQFLSRYRKKLLPVVSLKRIEKIKRISPRETEKLLEAKLSKNLRNISIKAVSPSINTYENRFIKMLLTKVVEKVLTVSVFLKDDKNSKKTNVSKTFIKTIDDSLKILLSIKNDEFWKNVQNMNRNEYESRVLNHDPTYSNIRRCWINLNSALELTTGIFKGGILNSAQLYEKWVFCKILQAISENGWEQNKSFKTENIKNVSFKKGQLDLNVLYQPVASERGSSLGSGNLYATPCSQIPDFLVKITRNDLSGCPTFSWILDAKYRIENNCAPEDAINQMHQYRDAVLWRGKRLKRSLIRETLGAFVVYPGKHSSIEAINQIQSINRTNIGALPLLPSNEDGGFDHFKEIISQILLPLRKNKKTSTKEPYSTNVPKVLFRKKDLVANVSLRATKDNMDSSNYWKTCRLYRLPLSGIEFLKVHPEHWTYIIPQGQTQNYGLFPIITFETIERKKVIQRYRENNIPIYTSAEKADDLYILFELGEPLPVSVKTAKLRNRSVLKTAPLKDFIVLEN